MDIEEPEGRIESGDVLGEKVEKRMSISVQSASAGAISRCFTQ